MVVPPLVPCDFANVDIVVGAFQRVGAGSLVIAREEIVKEGAPNCLCRYVVYLLGLMLNNNNKEEIKSIDGCCLMKQLENSGAEVVLHLVSSSMGTLEKNV